jgi:hypothetical protein
MAFPKLTQSPAPIETKQPPKPPLKDRIEALRAEIDACIDELAAERKKGSPSEPILCIRRDLTAFTGDCQCRAYLHNIGEFARRAEALANGELK